MDKSIRNKEFKAQIELGFEFKLLSKLQWTNLCSDLHVTTRIVKNFYDIQNTGYRHPLYVGWNTLDYYYYYYHI